MRRPISYYDNVKDEVDDSNDTSKPSFDTLRKAAEENSQSEEEREGDDTDIEVLKDSAEAESVEESSGIQEIGGQDQKQDETGGRPERETEERPAEEPRSERKSSSTDQVERSDSEIEDKLDTIIEQNERMIEILESFGS